MLSFLLLHTLLSTIWYYMARFYVKRLQLFLRSGTGWAHSLFHVLLITAPIAGSQDKCLFNWMPHCVVLWHGTGSQLVSCVEHNSSNHRIAGTGIKITLSICMYSLNNPTLGAMSFQALRARILVSNGSQLVPCVVHNSSNRRIAVSYVAHNSSYHRIAD